MKWKEGEGMGEQGRDGKLEASKGNAFQRMRLSLSCAPHLVLWMQCSPLPGGGVRVDGSHSDSGAQASASQHPLAASTGNHTAGVQAKARGEGVLRQAATALLIGGWGGGGGVDGPEGGRTGG